MTSGFWLPLAILLSSLLPGILIFLLDERKHRLRTALNLGGATLKLALIGILVWGVFNEMEFETRLTLAPGMDLVLHADALSVLFVTLSTGLWFVTTLYAVGYLEDAPHRSRFFGFFSLCVSATVGIAMAGNMLTFLFFYELLTLSTYPLVVHRGTPEALRGGRIYLTYTIIGGAVLLAGVARSAGFYRNWHSGQPHRPGQDDIDSDFRTADRWTWCQGRAGPAARLATPGNDRAGTRERPAARGCRGQGRRLWHRQSCL